MAPDFIERMVALFRENPACVTAIGLAVGVYPDGREVSSLSSNQRPRFMPGHEMALAAIDGQPVFGNPGFSFVVRRDALVAAGGFHESFEQHLLYGIAAFGVTGFDPEAHMYWRYHEGQLNKALSDRGWIPLRYSRSLLQDFGLERRWAEAFGAAAARKVALFIETGAYDTAAELFATNLASFRFAAAWNTLRIAGLDRHFLARLPMRLWDKRRWFVSSLLRVTGLRSLLRGRQA
ncbi:Glycosyltransferase (fragment) [Candidatus Terasakiella magnetica]